MAAGAEDAGLAPAPEPEPEPEPAELEPDDPPLAPLGPAPNWPHSAGGLVNLAPCAISTEAPGTGNWTIADSSGNLHPGEILATNMSGKEGLSRFLEIGWLIMSRLLDPPVTVTGAQFMYISRLPTWLNQVQAREYLPGAMPCGMLNWKVEAPLPLGSSPRLPSVFAGQPPSMLWMTCHLDDAVGARSVVRLIWQEPPPWTALPVKERV